VAVTAVRTGCGKSPTTRRLCAALQDAGRRVVVVRHPMPYGDLAAQRAQRFGTLEDLQRHHCTIEEREEYEPHLVRGIVVYAGVDYAEILARAEEEADVIVWDGGNNDFPFYKPDLWITIVDPHRAGHETAYYPGSLNVRMADVVVVNKVDTAQPEAVGRVLANVRRINPTATVIQAASPIHVDRPELIRGRRVLVIEDGPTVTHGEMAYGAGTLAAERCDAAELIDPHPYAVGSLADALRNYPHIGRLLPAVGYGAEQIRDLAETIRRAAPEAVVAGTPIDLARVVGLGIPVARASYELREMEGASLADVIREFLGGEGVS
jgi:predicted GTPase